MCHNKDTPTTTTTMRFDPPIGNDHTYDADTRSLTSAANFTPTTYTLIRPFSEIYSNRLLLDSITQGGEVEIAAGGYLLKLVRTASTTDPAAVDVYIATISDSTLGEFENLTPTYPSSASISDVALPIVIWKDMDGNFSVQSVTDYDANNNAGYNSDFAVKILTSSTTVGNLRVAYEDDLPYGYLPWNKYTTSSTSVRVDEFGYLKASENVSEGKCIVENSYWAYGMKVYEEMKLEFASKMPSAIGVDLLDDDGNVIRTCEVEIDAETRKITIDPNKGFNRYRDDQDQEFDLTERQSFDFEDALTLRWGENGFVDVLLQTSTNDSQTESIVALVNSGKKGSSRFFVRTEASKAFDVHMYLRVRDPYTITGNVLAATALSALVSSSYYALIRKDLPILSRVASVAGTALASTGLATAFPGGPVPMLALVPNLCMIGTNEIARLLPADDVTVLVDAPLLVFIPFASGLLARFIRYGSVDVRAAAVGSIVGVVQIFVAPTKNLASLFGATAASAVPSFFIPNILA